MQKEIKRYAAVVLHILLWRSTVTRNYKMRISIGTVFRCSTLCRLMVAWLHPAFECKDDTLQTLPKIFKLKVFGKCFYSSLCFTEIKTDRNRIIHVGHLHRSRWCHGATP
jgi:hypothetical protein